MKPTRTIASAKTFGGYACTTDCSGHQAGYDWAERHGITEGYPSYAGLGPYGDGDSDLDSDDPYADPGENDE